MNTEKRKTAVLKREKIKSASGARTDSDKEFSFGIMLKNCIFSVLVSSVVSVVLLLLFSLISYSNPDPDKLIFPLALASLYICAFLSGIITSRKNGEKILLGGILSGCIYLVMVFAVSLVPEESAFVSKLSDSQSVIAHIAVIAAAVFGSFAGMKKESGKTSVKHRRKIPRN